MQTAESKAGEFTVPKTTYRVDGYSKKYNAIYEYHGDFWHGNIMFFDGDDINSRNKKTYGDLYIANIEKKLMLRKLGYGYACIWEYRWRNAIRAVTTLQRKWCIRNM